MERAARANGLEGSVQRVAVLRALMLGDMLVAVPALRALRARLPGAHVTWIGLEPTRALVGRFSHLVDDFLALPGYPGLPEVPHEPDALPGFLERAVQRRFDLALQWHGSGGIVNGLVARLGARRLSGFASPGEGAAPAGHADRFLDWPERGTEVDRLLAAAEHLGCPPRGRHLEFPLQAEDRRALDIAWPGHADCRSWVCLHAGSQLPSRRWPTARFTEVGRALQAAGHTVVLTGGIDERPLAQAIALGLPRPAVDLTGRTSLGALGALLGGALALVSNDTSVSHVAAAIGCPSVVVSLGADVPRWRPADATRHRVVWHDVPCRPCAHRVCPIGHPCSTAIGASDVIGELRGLGVLEAAAGTVPVSARAPEPELVP